MTDPDQPPAVTGPDQPPAVSGPHRPPAATSPPDPAATMRAAVEALARPPTPSGAPFVSDLSVGELVLLDEVGYEPVDLVVGAGAASFNPQAATAPRGCDAWAWALTHACTAARTAVEQELATRRADGVVAVHLDLRRHPVNVVLATMVGTAVRRRDARHGHHGGATTPFTATLSAADFHLLVRAGHRPAAMVVGAAVAAFPPRSVTQGLGLSRENVELADQTAALYAAREQAMARLDAEARQVAAEGVVGVSFAERPFTTLMVHAVELLVLGTAIRSDGEPRPLRPDLQLSLDDPPQDVFRRG